jgi:heme/copper-type cytochrome/quinol oxidase subunit 2
MMGGRELMLIEGEITNDLLTLIYIFATIIIIYVIIFLILFIFHRKGEAYKKKQKIEMNRYNQERMLMIQESEKKPNQQDDIKHNPT